MQDSVPSYRAKVTQQFLYDRTLQTCFIAADEWASYSPDLNALQLHLGYPAGFGVRKPTTSVCKSIPDLKEAIQNNWKKVTSETVRKSIVQ